MSTLAPATSYFCTYVHKFSLSRLSVDAIFCVNRSAMAAADDRYPVELQVGTVLLSTRTVLDDIYLVPTDHIGSMLCPLVQSVVSG